MTKMSLKLTNGDIYHNLYFCSSIDELAEEIEDPPRSGKIIFHEKKAKGFHAVPIDINDIIEIIPDNDFHADVSYLQEIPGSNQTVVMYDPTQTYDYDEEGHLPKLKGTEEMVESILTMTIESYEKEIPEDDRDEILNTAMSVVIGYLESSQDINDPDITEDDLYSQGYMLAIAMSLYIVKNIETGHVDVLIDDMYNIVPQFTLFLENNEKAIMETTIKTSKLLFHDSKREEHKKN